MGNRMSNIATPMPPIRARFTSKLGIPLSGCKVYTYEPNSNIPKTTWIDIDKTVENTNPILLDAAGEADIFLDGLYQIVVKDRFGFTIYDVEKTGTHTEWDASFVVDASGETQQQINDLLPTYADKSTSLQAAINNSADGNTINLSGKTYPSDIDVDSKHLVGVGYNTRINVASGEYGVKSLATSPIWNRYKIKDLTIEGDNLNGIGFTFDKADATSGRRNIEYVSFKWLDIAINKPSGNIGNTYSNCNFDLCNYGFKAVHNTSGVMMHSGCDTFRDAQFSNIKKWAIDIVNTTQGGGQFSIQDSTIQFCQGGGIRIDYSNTIPYAPITIRNVWFESIATSATVNRDGVDEVPREIKLINTPICIIEESYLKNIELINSTAIARYCRIDNSAEYPQFFIDSNSQLLLEYLYVDGFVPDNLTVKSIAKQSRNTSSGTDLSLCGEAPTSVVSSPQNASSFVGETYDGIVGQTTWELLGSQSINAGCVRDGVLQESCIEIPLTKGITSVFNNIQLTAGKWAVWGVSAKAVGAIGGKFEFFRDFKLGDVRIKFDEWVHTFGIAKIATSGLVGCWIQPSSGGSLRLQNLFIAQFDNEADALAFANSRVAVDSRQHSASTAWNPPSLASGALQTAAIALNGAKIGDPVSVSFNQPLRGTFIWGEVTSDNNVTIYHKNLSATTVDLGLGVLSVHRI